MSAKTAKPVKKRQELREQLDNVLRSDGMKLDLASNCVHGVKLLGWNSKNSNRRYLPEGVNPQLYENVPVNVDHPTEEEKKMPRPLAARFGWTANAVQQADGIYGDLYFNPKHHLAESFLWWVQNKPDKIGLSHNAFGDVWEGEDGEVVENVDEVRSVDLVSDPATTKGMFEAYHGPQGRAGRVSNPNKVSLPSQPPEEEDENEDDWYDEEGNPRSEQEVAQMRKERGQANRWDDSQDVKEGDSDPIPYVHKGENARYNDPAQQNRPNYGAGYEHGLEGKKPASDHPGYLAGHAHGLHDRSQGWGMQEGSSPFDDDSPEDLFDEEGNERHPEDVAKIRKGKKVVKMKEGEGDSPNRRHDWPEYEHKLGYHHAYVTGEPPSTKSGSYWKGYQLGTQDKKAGEPHRYNEVEEAIPDDEELARQAEDEIFNAKPEKLSAHEKRDAKTEIAQAEPYRSKKMPTPMTKPVLEDDEEELPLPPGAGPEEEMPPGGGEMPPPGSGDEAPPEVPPEDGGMDDMDGDEGGPPVDSLDLTDEMMASIEKVARSGLSTEGKKKRIIAILKGMMHDAMEAVIPKDLPSAKKLLRESRLMPRKATRMVLKKLEAYEVAEAFRAKAKKAAELCESMRLPKEARSPLFMEDLANCNDEKRMRMMIEDRRQMVGVARSSKPRSAAGFLESAGENKKKPTTAEEVRKAEDAAMAEFEAAALGGV